MNDILQEIEIPHIFAAFFGLFLILRIRQHSIKKSIFFKAWRDFAGETGFDLTPDSFRSPFGKIEPEISGDYLGKKVQVTASYLGVYGARHALLNFLVMVENPSTAMLPAGAFLVIRKDPSTYGFGYRLRRILMGKKTETLELQDSYQIRGIPKNLGNYIFRQESTEKLIQIPGMLDLHIDRENLSYSLIAQITDGGFLRQILEDLSELAISFDRFAKNWI